MSNYVEKCESLERKLRERGWDFRRETSQSWVTIPKLSEVKLDCSEIKKTAMDVYREYSVKNEGCFEGRLSDVVCRSTSSGMIVLEDLPNLYDMKKFKTYQESREKDLERYYLLTEVVKQIIAA